MNRAFRRTGSAGLALALGLLVVVEAGDLFLVRDAATRAGVSNVLQVIAALIAAGTVIAAARRLRRERSASAQGWAVISFGGCLYLVGALAFWQGDLLSLGGAYPGVPDLLFIASYPLMMVGLARLPRDRLSDRERWDAALDFGILSLVTGIAVWELSLQELWNTLLAKADAASLVSLDYTLLNFTLLLVLYLRLVLNLGHGRMFVPNLLLVAAGLCLTTSDLAIGHVLAASEFTSGSPVDLGWVLFAAFAGLAGLYVLDRGDDAGIVHGSVARASWSTAVSFACLAGASGALVWGVHNRGALNLPLVATGIAGTVVLAGIRQLRAVRQAARLSDGLERARADLEVKVRGRTAELEATGASLRASEEKYRVLFEMESDALVLVDNATGRILEANAAATSLYGYTRDELLARTHASLSAEPEDEPRLTGAARIAPDLFVTIPLRWHRKKDGTVFPVEITGRSFTWNGRQVHLAAIRDITERRELEAAQERALSLLQATLEATADGLLVVDLAGRVTACNDRFATLLHVPPDVLARGDAAEVRSCALDDLADPEAFLTRIRELLAQPDAESFDTLRRRDGRVYERVSRPQRQGGEIVGRVWSFRDVTDRARSLEELKERELKYRNLFDNAEVGMLRVRVDGSEILEANRRFLDILGRTRDEVVGRSSLGHWADPRERDEVIRRIEADGRVDDLEIRLRNRKGGVRTCLISMRLFREEGVLEGAVLDVTARRESEAALQRAQRRADVHLANSPVAVVEFDSGFRVTRWAGQAERIFGWSEDEVVGRTVGEMRWIHEDDAESVRQAFEDMAADRWSSVAGAHRSYRKDGAIIHCEWHNSASFDAQGRLSSVLAIILDVTPRVRAEERLRALARHLVAVREEDHTRMAREIHDELGQGLSALRLDLTWMARKPPKDTAVLRRRYQAAIALIDEMIAVGQRIVADLRPPILDDLGLVPAMEWYLQRFAEHSGVPTTLDAGSPPGPEVPGPLAVTAYRIVQEALTNVSRHAQAKHATVRIAVEDGRLVLEIRDDGRGVPKKALDDPHSFGLVGMRERAASVGGVVQVTSTPRRGTTVRVTIPLQQAAVAPR